MSAPTDLRPYLRTLDAETLADLLHAQAERDPELRHVLEVRAVTHGGDVAAAHRLLDAAVCDGNAGYALKVDAVLDTLRRMLDAGSRADLAPLARRTVDDVGATRERQGDPAGDLGERLERAIELYARACVARPPDPARLAEWLVDVSFRPGWPPVAVADFAEALGEQGLRQLQSTVDKILGKTAEGPRRAVAQRLQEELAEALGDVDGLVAILSAKPPQMAVSLKIVRVLRAAGRHTEAIAHAARALTHDKPRLAPPPAREPDNLVERRTEFEHAPGRETYVGLRDAAIDAGRWTAERRAALQLLRERAAETGADELARILLDEGRHDEAWRACVRFGASLDLRVELAEARAAEHPAETIPVYRSHVEALIEHKDPQAYREAALALRKLRTLHKKAGTPEEFSAYLGGLVEVHRRKSRLIAEVRAARIALPKTRNPAANGSLTG